MGQAQQADDLVMVFADAAWKPRLRLAFEGRRAAIWRGPIPSPFVRRMVRQSPFEACGREQPGDFVMMFTGSAGKRKIRLALFANLSPCGGVSDSYLVCFSPDPFRAAGGIVFARQSGGGGI